MQTKHYFHELTLQQKRFYFANEMFASSRRMRLFMAAALITVFVFDIILRTVIFPPLSHGKSYPLYKLAAIPLILGVVTFVLSFVNYPNLSEKWLNRVRKYLSFITTGSGGVYQYMMILDFLGRALKSNDEDDWTFSLISLSNGIHQTAFIIAVSPSWMHTVFGISCNYTAMITAYMRSDNELKHWLLVKSIANLFYVTLYVLIGTFFRWKMFLKSSEAEAWNQVYNDTLDRIPSSIAVMNVSGNLIYSNSEFKRTSENDPQKLFRSITNLKLRDFPLLSTSEGFFPKTSHEEFITNLPSTRNQPPPSSSRSTYQMLKNKEALSPNSARFNKLEELLDHYRSLLSTNDLKKEEPVIYDSKMEIKTLYNRHIFSYEVIIRPLVEYKKIVIILNNTTQRDLVASLEDNNDYKDKLLASISHELRTPLNGNLVLLQAAVQEENVPKAVKERLLMPALRSGRLLSHLINDILDYSTMLSDKITLYCETRPMRESLEYCCQLLEHVFKTKQLKFNLIIDLTVPHLFCTDHQRLIQVILNLLSNALKFTFNGGVTVEATLAEDEGPPTVEISISDTGIGMSKDAMLNLFEEDLLTTSRGNVTSKGVGLGLKVASKLVRMLGPKNGDGLEVKSVDGEGSVFSFKIVHQAIDEEEDEDEERLMDEFNESNCSLPDIPVEISHDKKSISIKKVKHSKFKRVDLRSPGSTLKKFSKDAISATKIAKSASKIAKSGKVLIVDDDLINILALETLLKQLKIKADSAYNGQQGIEKVLAHPDKYQIIFMDCQMPVMDGFEATRQLKEKMKSEEIPVIPIVGCTAFSAKNKIDECIKCGMVEVMNKPVLKEKLKQILEKYI